VIRFSIVLASLAVLALAGCTADAPPATERASSTPTTAPALTAPRAALPLSCAELLPLARVQSHLSDPVTIHVDETHLPPSLDDMAVVAAGGTECVWGGQYMTDSTYDTGVSLAILPEAASAFAASEANVGGDGYVSNTIGDGSSYQCTSTGESGGDWCTGDALVSGYWVSFLINDSNGPSGDTAVTGTMAEVVAAIRAAGPERSNWTPPASDLDPERWCTATDAAARIGTVTGGAVSRTDYEPRLGIRGIAAERAKVTGCIWITGQGGYFAVVTIPGGAWAIPMLADAPPMWTLIGPPSTLSLTGSTGAVRGCGDHCEAMIGIGTDLVDISQAADSDVSPTFDVTAQRFVDSSTP
jgi:hypothetical protein